MRPDAVLPQLIAQDPAAPRVTCYDDTETPTGGERVELSARVLANWVAKAGDLLQDELDAGPGSVVALDLPAEHWRTLYWALAAWAVGATVADAGAADEADVLVTDRPRDGHPAQVVVTLAALARSAAVPVPAGAVDEAAELAGRSDVLVPAAAAAGSDPALRAADGTWTYDELVVADGREHPRVLVTGDLAPVLRAALAAWAAGGSVVLCRGSGSACPPQRLVDEGVVPAPDRPVRAPGPQRV